jgi:hypothetical protein
LGGNLLATTVSGGIFAVTPATTTTYYARLAGGSGSQTFAFTSNTQTFTVPTGVTVLHVLAKGAKGSQGWYGSPPTNGEVVEADMSVASGQTLTIVVGGAGSTGIGGYNGGGSSVNYTDHDAGDGASDIRIGGTALANRLAVAVAAVIVMDTAAKVAATAVAMAII